MTRRETHEDATATSSTPSSGRAHLEPMWKEDWEHYEERGAHVELGPHGEWEVYHDPRSEGPARRVARRDKAANKEAAREHVTKMLPRFGFAG